MPSTVTALSPLFSIVVGCVLISPPLTVTAQETAPAPSAPEVVELQPRSNSLGMSFLPVKRTPILMSSHPVRVSDFRAFVEDQKYEWNYSPHFPQGDDHPVVNITLQDAAAFCDWLTEKERKSGAITDLQSYRLPNNREWDSALGLASARKNTLSSDEEIEESQSFPWGTQWPPPPKAGNFNSVEIDGSDDGYPYTSPVGAFNPNGQGFYDMAGNVWQWVWDRDNPLVTGAVLRGGSWMYFRKECLTSTYRYQVPNNLRAPSIGFRVVFEDRHQTAIFLANEEKMRAEEDKQQREMLTMSSKVTEEEIAKMRASLEERRNMPAQTATEVSVPDLASLKPAQPDAPFTSSLGLKFHPIGLPGILFGETEVRVQDYEAGPKPWTNKPSFTIQPTHPIINVTWEEANAYAEWLTKKDREAKLIPDNAFYRLPTDAEWSFAAGLKEETGGNPQEKHAGNTEDFPWGRNQWPPPPLSANLDTGRMVGYSDNFSYTAPVGSFSPNSNNIHDLAGNAAEWCSDPWPDATGERVVRGSSWISAKQEECYTSHRQHFSESTTLPHLGFRLVLQLQADATTSSGSN